MVITSNVTETTQLYAICFGGIFILFLLKTNIFPYVQRFMGWLSVCGAKYFTYRFILHRHTFLGPWTVASVIGQIGYITANLVCLGYPLQSLSEVASRAGRLSLVNTMPVFLGTHLSFLADRFGISLKTCRFLHRSSALLSFFLLIFHVLAEVMTQGSLSLDTWRDRYTFAGALALCLLVLLSVRILRKHWYEIFLRVHQVLAVLLVLGTWQHLLSVANFPWLYVYIFGAIFCGLNSFQVALIIYRNKAWGRPLPQAIIRHSRGAIRISVHLWRPVKIDAGQHIQLWIGSVGLFQSHPFIVTSWAEIEQNTLELFIQPRSGFTANLPFSGNSDTEKYLSHLALFSGPHGVTLPVWDFETVLMVATGFGIAAMAPYLKKLIHGYNLCKGRTRRVHLVWQVPSLGEDFEFLDLQALTLLDLVSAARDLLNDTLSDDTLDDGYILCISIYQENGFEEKQFGTHKRVTVFPGKPDLGDILKSEVNGDFLMPDIEHILNGKVNEDFFEKLQKFEREKGRVLFMVSGTGEVRDECRKIVRQYLDQKVQLQELDYQPE